VYRAASAIEKWSVSHKFVIQKFNLGNWTNLNEGIFK
jgi:hypothetical protein